MIIIDDPFPYPDKYRTTQYFEKVLREHLSRTNIKPICIIHSDSVEGKLIKAGVELIINNTII